MDGEKEYVTKLELFESQKELKHDVSTRIDEVDEKVDQLNRIVLPLVESSKQTAKNTERIATSLDEFTAEQRRTNGNLYKKVNDHEVALTNLGAQSRAQIDSKKANATIIVAIITAGSGIIVGIFNLAPLLFQ